MSRLTKSGWRWFAAWIAGGIICVTLVGGALDAALRISPECAQELTAAEQLPYPKTNKGDSREGEFEIAERHFCYARHTPEEWIGILTAALAGFTGALAMATAALWLDAKANGERQTAHTEEIIRQGKASSERQALEFAQQLELTRISTESTRKSVEAYQVAERAWIVVAAYNSGRMSGRVNGLPFVGRMFEIVWRNGGRTPATACEAWGDHLVVPVSQDTSGLQFILDEYTAQPASPAGPDSMFNGPLRPVSEDDIAAMKRGESRIFLWGFVRYRSIFGGSSYHTETCVEISYRGMAQNPMTGEPEELFAYIAFGKQNTSS